MRESTNARDRRQTVHVLVDNGSFSQSHGHNPSTLLSFPSRKQTTLPSILHKPSSFLSSLWSVGIMPSPPLAAVLGRAVDLAERHDFPQIEALLVRHTGQLLQKGDPLQAVEVFRLAGKATDAALLLAKLAEDAGKKKTTLPAE